MTPQDFARYEREARSLWHAPSTTLDLLSSAPGEFGDWRDLAACTSTDPEAFFPEKIDENAMAAKRVCARCDVRAECLEFALAMPVTEDWGIWGGMSANSRRKLRKRRAAEVAAAEDVAAA